MNPNLGNITRIIVETDRAVLMDMQVDDVLRSIAGQFAERVGIPCTCKLGAEHEPDAKPKEACPRGSFVHGIRDAYLDLVQKGISAVAKSPHTRITNAEGPGFARCLVRLRDLQVLLAAHPGETSPLLDQLRKLAVTPEWNDDHKQPGGPR